ncbi:MAG: ABC transporter permease [Rhizobiales bacterium]|nr:ABC transporter permease [Hyphomicrobiales bacterium]
MGLTARQKAALDAITAHVGRHGVMPSRSTLAEAMGCSKNNAARLIQGLVARDELNTVTRGGALSGFGGAGVSVFVPAYLAAQLAAFCAANAERIPAVVADAIMLHLDQLAGGE